MAKDDARLVALEKKQKLIVDTLKEFHEVIVNIKLVLECLPSGLTEFRNVPPKRELYS